MNKIALILMRARELEKKAADRVADALAQLAQQRTERRLEQKAVADALAQLAQQRTERRLEQNAVATAEHGKTVAYQKPTDKREMIDQIIGQLRKMDAATLYRICSTMNRVSNHDRGLCLWNPSGSCPNADKAIIGAFSNDGSE